MDSGAMNSPVTVPEDLPSPSDNGGTTNSQRGTFQDLLGPDGDFLSPITNYTILDSYNEAYLAKNNVEIEAPPALPASDAQRTEFADRLLRAFLHLDPEVVYPKDQAYTGIFGDTVRDKAPRFKQFEMRIKAWLLLHAIENASQGICQLPEMQEASFPKYVKFETFDARFNKVEYMLQRQKKFVNNIMTSGTYHIRLAWAPNSEEKRVGYNANSAAKKKKEYEAGKPKDNGGNSASTSTQEPPTKRPRVLDNNETPSQPTTNPQPERQHPTTPRALQPGAPRWFHPDLQPGLQATIPTGLQPGPPYSVYPDTQRLLYPGTQHHAYPGTPVNFLSNSPGGFQPNMNFSPQPGTPRYFQPDPSGNPQANMNHDFNSDTPRNSEPRTVDDLQPNTEHSVHPNTQHRSDVPP
ncbi:hypothetical protein GGR57DRAFT_513987 [Xylariaceae sp. FL1272]|nr:hypothetical protein GGR57DRAFT_513987 [Xylariaceae sp. FL1272]